MLIFRVSLHRQTLGITKMELKQLVCSLVIMASSGLYATVNPNDLVKVTPENNPGCVEYYSYKNAMYCSTIPKETQVVDPKIKDYEKQNILFDDRPWQAAWGRETPTITSVEYIPRGDNIDQWHELITSEYIPDPQNHVSPKQFSEISMQGIKDAGFSPIIKIIKDTPDQIILEFRIESPANQAQDELQIITKREDALYAVHYTMKGGDMGQKNREKWLRNLGAVSIK